MALDYCAVPVDCRGQEIKAHGTPAFPVACYQDDLLREAISWHWHEELEVLWVTEGSAVAGVGELRYTLDTGDFLFVNTGVLHGIWNPGAVPCRFHSVVFHPRLIGEQDTIFWHRYLDPLLTDQSLRCLHLGQNASRRQEAVHRMELAWQACMTEAPCYEFQVREALSKLICLLPDPKCTPDPPSARVLRDRARIKEMLRYIHDHYGQELTMSQIAHSASISESECLRCFRTTIDDTPIQYLRRYRIQRAAQLLVSTDWRVSDIGTQCGFQDMSYFTKSFRVLKGCTPSEYRRDHKK